MTFSFGIMVHQHTTISMLRNFISTVNALGIPPPQYEIIVAGDWQQKPEDFSLLRTLGPFVHVCGDCEFTDKIRTIFEVANHEFVWVSHDYILPLPTFYDAMRSFGRGAPWMVPGILLDFNGREIDEFVLRGRLWTSHHYTKFTSNNTGTEPISIPSESRSELLCGAHHHHADYYILEFATCAARIARRECLFRNSVYESKVCITHAISCRSVAIVAAARGFGNDCRPRGASAGVLGRSYRERQ